jgi:hypothetical protein
MYDNYNTYEPEETEKHVTVPTNDNPLSILLSRSLVVGMRKWVLNSTAHAQSAFALRSCRTVFCSYLEDSNVGEDHDQQWAVEGDSAGEYEVAQVLCKQALPLGCWP